MFVVLAIIVVGVIIGSFINSPKAPTLFSKLLGAIIYLLLLVMGIVVGGNEQIVNNLSTIGLRALIITVGSVMGSALCALLLYKYIYQRGNKR